MKNRRVKMDVIKLEYKDIFDDNKSKELVFSRDLLPKNINEKSIFPLIVDGKSMQPVINDRAVVIADLSQKELVNDGIYLVYYENRMWVKRYNLEKKEFFSINPDFSHLVYKQEDVHLVAKVILTFTVL